MPIESIPAGFELTERGKVKTPKGIILGGAYDMETQRQMQKNLGTVAKCLQAALAKPIETRSPWYWRLWYWLRSFA